MATPRMIFVNLPVRELARSMAFYAKLGFEFDPRFTDDKAACMILRPDASYVMLLSEPFFRGFTRKEPCDARTHAQALLAISCDSRAAVEEMVRRAIDAGGAPAIDPQDHGSMFAWSFCDPDGHQWEPVWMDPAFVPAKP